MEVSCASRIQTRHDGLEAVASLAVGELVTAQPEPLDVVFPGVISVNWLRVSIGIGAALLNDWQNGHGEAGDGMIGTIPGGFRRGADEREHGVMRRR